MNILIFLIVLAVLVLVHEFGHFIVAKKSGIRVDEFGLGFPPRLYGKKFGETVYSINMIPFGGFVKIFGENPDEESMNGVDNKRSLHHKSKWIQGAVISAGIVFNILFAWVLFSLVFVIGKPTSIDETNKSVVTREHTYIEEVFSDTPAKKAGLLAGDEIISLLLPTHELLMKPDMNIVRSAIEKSAGTVVIFKVKRIDVEKDISVVALKGVVGDSYAVGISMSDTGTLRLPIYRAVWEGGKFTVDAIKVTVSGLWTLLGNILSGSKGALKDVSGPLGIIKYVGDATKLGFVYLLVFTGLISINLAVINLVPFPALDGGRLFFIIIEAVIRRPIKASIQNTVNIVGFSILIIFMIVITISDIIKL